jgi:L-ribulose-5-phosphate 4-epimerase
LLRPFEPHWSLIVDAVAEMSRHPDVFMNGHGGVACIDRQAGFVFTKPSGWPFSEWISLNNKDNVALKNLNGGAAIGRVSFDMDSYVDVLTRLDVEAVCHSHSTYATAFAMNRAPINVCCTEHADVFGNDILVANPPVFDWGKQIDAEDVKTGAKLLGGHGVVTFGSSPLEAVNRAIVLEEIARKTFLARQLTDGAPVRLGLNVTRKFNERYNAKKA